MYHYKWLLNKNYIKYFYKPLRTLVFDVQGWVYNPDQRFSPLEISSGKILSVSKIAQYAPSGFSSAYRTFLEEHGTPKSITDILQKPFSHENTLLTWLDTHLSSTNVEEMINTEILYLNNPGAYDCYQQYFWANMPSNQNENE